MLDLGLRAAIPHARTICMVEREAYCIEILARRMQEGWLHACPLWTDLATFDGRPWRGSVDLIAAGFSCQPWSNAGKQLGVLDPRWIWPEIRELIRVLRPRNAFFENVTGLLALPRDGGGEPTGPSGLELILCDLAELGFNVEWGTFSAAEIGAPHIRKRLFILADAGEPRLSHTECPDIRSTGEAEIRGAAPELRRALFPPGPEDLEAWGSIPEDLQPSTESTICGMADGPADRMGSSGSPRAFELRALGNGLVPATAALAFAELAERLGIVF